MKLHLPKSLRTALLACLAALAPVAVTLATGAISAGAVVFSLGTQAPAETISITADTNWNVTTDHSNDTTTVSGSGTELKVGDGNGGDAGLSATGEIKLGELSIEEAAQLTISGTTTADRTTNPDEKVGVFGAITLSDSTLYFTDGSYYMEDAVTVSGESTVRCKWGKAVQFSALVGEESSVLTLANQSTGTNPAGFILGVGGSSSAAYSGTIKLVDESNKKSVELVLNDFTAYSAAAFELDSRSNVIVTLPQVSLGALYGSGSVGKSSAYGSNAAGATLVVSGNAAEGKYFSGTVESAVTWQIGDGTTAASSRFNGATLKGTLNVQTKATAYLTGANSVATLNNTGTLSFADGSTLTLGSMANDFYGGKTYTVGNLALTSGGAVSNWAPYFGYTDGTEMTYQGGQLTVTVDGSGYYWNGTAASYSWSAANLLKGGNAATIAAGGRLYLTADAAYKTVNMDSTVALAGIILQSDGYTLNVTADNTIPTNFAVQDSSYTLTKTGAAKLSMTSAQAAKLAGIAVNDGTLALTDRLPGDAESNDNAGAITYEADFTSLNVGANGTLAINAAEKANNNRTTVKLADSFAGTLEIVSGYVDTDSAFSGATIKVNGGGLLSRVPAGDIANNVIIGANGATFYSLGKTGVDETWKTKFTGAFSGSGTLTIQERGDWYFAGDMSGFTGSIVLNTSYDHVFFYSSASVSSFSASARLGTNSTVYFGDGTNAMEFVVDKAMTVSEDTHFAIASGASFKNKNQVTISGGKTLKLTGSGAYNMDGWLNMGSGAKLDVQNTVVVSLANTTQTINAGEIAIATDAVVSDSRVLTLDGNLSITGAGTYKQLGSLTISDGTTLTLSGKVTLTQLDNNGVITLADSLSSLTLVGFSDQTNINGRTYEIGTVTDGADKDWNALLGVTSTPISYDATTGLLTAGEAADLVWADLTGDTENSWNEASNWLDANGNAASVPYTTSKETLI